MAQVTYIQWRSSATPIYVDEYTIADSHDGDLDGTKSRKIVKTEDDAQIIGGGETTAEIAHADRDQIEGAKDVSSLLTTTTSIDDILSITTKTVTFLGLQITGVAGSNVAEDVDLIIDLNNGTAGHIKLLGTGSSCALPLDSLGTEDVHIYSSGASKQCVFKILINRTD